METELVSSARAVKGMFVCGAVGISVLGADVIVAQETKTNQLSIFHQCSAPEILKYKSNQRQSYKQRSETNAILISEVDKAEITPFASCTKSLFS